MHQYIAGRVGQVEGEDEVGDVGQHLVGEIVAEGTETGWHIVSDLKTSRQRRIGIE